jgi:hypothetical protein
VIVGGAALAAASLGAGGASSARANDAGSVTHSAGQVSATIEWDKADYGIANPRLRAEIDRQHRAGRVSAGFKQQLLRKLKAWKYR